MNNKIFQNSQINLIIKRKIFFDANILIYLFFPTITDDPWAEKYASLFKKLYKQNNEIFINFIVIAEVINRVQRIEYSKYKRKNKKGNLKYKTYRNGLEGKSVFQYISQIFSDKILKFFKICSKDYNKNTIKDFFQIGDDLDFIDKAIVSLCKEQNYILLTNDIDFYQEDIEILTQNEKYFI